MTIIHSLKIKVTPSCPTNVSGCYVYGNHPTISFFVLSRPSLSGFISNLTIQRQHFPTDEDQTGAAKALLRLQDTYRLDANTISTGDLPGKGLKSCIVH